MVLCRVGLCRADTIRRRVSQFFYEDRIEPVSAEELAAAQAHAAEHHAHLDGAGKHRAELESQDASADSQAVPASEH